MKPGIQGRRTYPVTKEVLASAFGSGLVDVYATPAMIAAIENTAALSVESELEEGYTTVGTQVSVTPGRRSNALTSLVPAGLVGALSAIKAFVISRNAPRGDLVWQLVLTVLVTYAGCFLLLEIMRAIREKRRRELDEGED